MKLGNSVHCECGEGFRAAETRTYSYIQFSEIFFHRVVSCPNVSTILTVDTKNTRPFDKTTFS